MAPAIPFMVAHSCRCRQFLVQWADRQQVPRVSPSFRPAACVPSLLHGRYVPLLGKVTVAMLERNLVRLFYNFHNKQTAA